MQPVQSPEQRAEIVSMLKNSLAMGEAIAELGTVPAGKLYATVCDVMTLRYFEAIIGHLVDANVVQRSSSGLLTWTGERSKLPTDA